MKIYKFGGASIKCADAIRKMVDIVEKCNNNLIIVVSAMGKTTNKLEVIAAKYFEGKNYTEEIEELIANHIEVSRELFSIVPEKIHLLFKKLTERLQKEPSLDFDFEYDQIVSYGEILSTTIISEYFRHTGETVEFVDIRNVIKTDNNYREASVLWDLTKDFSNKTFNFDGTEKYITQGFIGSTTHNQTTTLGREGSDYSAAILAACCNAESMTVWKDVPGIMNADPKWIEDAVKINHLSYNEAIELTYYGAKVIHPNTIKPLKDSNIPLYVNSFLEPDKTGSVIDTNGPDKYEIPIFIRKENQILVSVKPKDFGLITEDHIREVFDVLSSLRIRVHLTQISAVSFTFCIDKKDKAFRLFTEKISLSFNMRYNTSAELITIRHFDNPSIERLHKNGSVLIEQRTRKTAQVLRVDGM